MKVFFDDSEFDAQFARTVGKSVVGMADVGECFAAASRMTPGDYGSWRDSWHSAAERVEHIAEEAAKAGRRRSAGEAYLRASEYHRASYFFDRVDLAGSFLRSAWEATKRTFQHGLSYLDVAVEVITVPYAGTRLTGYLIRPEGAGARPYPTVVTVAGYDSPIEEYYAYNAVGGTSRGYAVLMVDGPGQGSALYDQNLVFRPDYEVVFAAILDLATERPEVDRERIALSGRSFGGYLAPRAACFENRVRALIADPGLYDLGSQVRAMVASGGVGTGGRAYLCRDVRARPTPRVLFHVACGDARRKECAGIPANVAGLPRPCGSDCRADIGYGTTRRRGDSPALRSDFFPEGARGV